MSRADAFVPIAQTTRSGAPESVHFGAVVALDRDGAIVARAGDPNVVIYPRSSNKPLQATAMVANGLVLPPELLALVCASHDGTPDHLEGVRRILATAGLDESALRNTADLPLDRGSAEDVLRGGGTRTPLQQNCSGKHAGMLLTCAVNGWPLDTYLDLQHPLHQAIDGLLPSLTGDPLGHIGIDGCGAPAHAMSLLALARAFRNMATGAAGDAGRQVVDAMRAHAEMVGGERRDVTRFMRHVPGLVAKDGAEAVFVAALEDGRAVAVKVADGGERACPVAVVSALHILGVDVSEVAPLVRRTILGHGQEVGAVTLLAGTWSLS
jgi:L-asparaginase II